MYPNLRAEMARRNIRQSDLAKELGKTNAMISLMLSGKTAINLDLAVQIQKIVNSEVPLDVLFAKDE